MILVAAQIEVACHRLPEASHKDRQFILGHYPDFAGLARPKLSRYR
ncbi:MAG: hypothetical protein WD558_07295 [Pseudomonadales bacterium]